MSWDRANAANRDVVAAAAGLVKCADVLNGNGFACGSCMRVLRKRLAVFDDAIEDAIRADP